jgi:hypothetical protein
VDIAFQPPRGGILCRDDALSRGADVFKQPYVAQHQAGLRGEVGDELSLVSGNRVAGRGLHDDCPEQIPLVDDREN